MSVINFLKNKINIKKFDPIKDEKLFYKWLKKEELDLCNFANHWTYIIQATRNFHGFIENDKGIVFLTKRWHRKTKYLVIVSFFGEGSLKILEKLIYLIKLSDYKIIIKNVTQNNFSTLKKLGFREYNKNESWINFESNNYWINNSKIKKELCKNNFINSDFRFDDNTFSDYVFDFNELLNLQGGRYSGIRRKINRFERNNVGDNKIVSTKYIDIEHEIASVNLLKSWAVEMAKNENEEFIEAIRAHEFCFFEDNNENFSKKFKIVLLKEKTSEVVGVSYLTLVKDNLFHNALFQKSGIKDFKKFIVIESLRYISQSYKDYNKIKYINFQGSETRSLDEFKKDFKPIKAQEKIHLIYK